MKVASKLDLIPLGGLGEIGMNCLAVASEERLLVIDCGVMFPGEELGADLIHPGFEYLVERREDIEAVVLTHAHEDHLSGLPFLLREIDVPVFGGAYALGLLKAKMSEADYSPRLMARPLHLYQDTRLGPFTVSSFPMPHSIVQNTGLVISAGDVRLLHTGDFKLGMAGDGGAAALATLERASEGGIDLMLADSTGSEEPEVAGEEADVARLMEQLFREARRGIFVAIFSSNIQRMSSVFEAAAKTGRRVALCGRSVQNHYRIARQSGGMNSVAETVISVEEAASQPPESVAFIVSGTQGEGRSALNRLSRGNHHLLSVEKDDLVILSSRFIPGNEIAISTMIDRLLMRGARVIHRGVMRDIHVSGHGGRPEIRAAIEAVRPRCYLPVHGTYRHLVAGAEIAASAGVRNIAVAVNGQRATLTASGLTISKTTVPVRRVFVDRGGTLTETIIKDRRILGSNGLLSVTLLLDDALRLCGEVELTARGVVANEMLPWLSGVVREKVRELVQTARTDAADEENGVVSELIRAGLRRFIAKQISREPLVLVSILRI